MSYEIGLLKYLVKTPLTRVGFISMYLFGGVVVTFLSTIAELFSGNYVEAFLEYFVYSAIPPTSLLKVLFLVGAGTTVAGLKWYIAMKCR
ncbi:hypothetical protein [Methanosarcina siciliae]|uniref:hypothetical protein n=1 Tax=Methanosarcina siciliae TaxID=38027 RepID=UPI000AB88E6F|nr:hypothetical protein [Methanosarcina siciliae]